jgi:hypothetical protein
MSAETRYCIASGDMALASAEGSWLQRVVRRYGAVGDGTGTHVCQ